MSIHPQISLAFNLTSYHHVVSLLPYWFRSFVPGSHNIGEMPGKVKILPATLATLSCSFRCPTPCKTPLFEMPGVISVFQLNSHQWSNINLKNLPICVLTSSSSLLQTTSNITV